MDQQVNEAMINVLTHLKEGWVLHFNTALRKAYLCHSDVEKYKIVPIALFNKMKTLQIITNISKDFVSDIYEKSKNVDYPN